MMRWLEEYEMKHVEFDRCIKAFNTMSSAWTKQADNSTHSGYRAFARKQSTMFSSLRDRADAMFKKVGSKSFVGKSGKDLVEAVTHFHEEELCWLKELAERR